MNIDAILAHLANTAPFLPADQRALIIDLDAIMMQTPPPADLSATSRIGWVFASISQDKASDFAGAIGVALMAGAMMAGHPADEAQRLAFGAVSEIAQAAATFVGEQRAATLSPVH